MVAHISDFAAAPVRCMKACQIAGLRSSLIILIFARLICISTIGIIEFVTSTPMTLLVASVAFHVHMSVPDMSQFINLQLAVPAEGNENTLACVVSEWAEQQVEIQGTSQIKVNTTALALLPSTRHTARSFCGRHRDVRWCLEGGKKRKRTGYFGRNVRFWLEEVELQRSKSEYEDNSSKEANLVKDFDKVKMILQGLEYEKEQGKVLDNFFQSMAGKHPYTPKSTNSA